MPLNPSAGIGANIKEFHKGPTFAHTARKFGRSDANRQAVAVALETARKAKRKADGGAASDDDGASVNVVQAPTSPNYDQANKDLQLTPQEQALYQRHLTNLSGPGGVDNPDGSRSTLYQSVQEHNGQYYNVPTVWNGVRETRPYVNPTTGQTMDVPNQTALANVDKAGWNTFPSYSTPDEADARYDQMHGYMEKDTADYLASKSNKKRGGPVNAAMEIARKIRRRAKGGKVHVGPIIGLTGGRADERKMHVPDGAYVFTADHVSGLGQGNTHAGMAVLDKMFPISAKSHVDEMPAKRASGGKVPIYAADGEYVVHPDDLKNMYSDLDHGHKILDAWQTHERNNLIDTLSKLPPPAQD
jgi:hypothetical protein